MQANPAWAGAIDSLNQGMALARKALQSVLEYLAYRNPKLPTDLRLVILSQVLHTWKNPQATLEETVAGYLCGDPAICLADAQHVLAHSTLVREELARNGQKTFAGDILTAQSPHAAMVSLAWTAVAEDAFLKKLGVSDLTGLNRNAIMQNAHQKSRGMPKVAMAACSPAKANVAHGPFGSCGAARPSGFVGGANPINPVDPSPEMLQNFELSGATGALLNPIKGPIAPAPAWMMPGKCFGLNPTTVLGTAADDNGLLKGAVWLTAYIVKKGAEQGFKNWVTAHTVSAAVTGFGSGVTATVTNPGGILLIEAYAIWEGANALGIQDAIAGSHGKVEGFVDSKGNWVEGKSMGNALNKSINAAKQAVEQAKQQHAEQQNDDRFTPAQFDPEQDGSFCGESLNAAMVGCMTDDSAANTDAGDLVCGKNTPSINPIGMPTGPDGGAACGCLPDPYANLICWYESDWPLGDENHRVCKQRCSEAQVGKIVDNNCEATCPSWCSTIAITSPFDESGTGAVDPQCAGCSEKKSRGDASLVALCASAKNLPPGLIALCGAIDPVPLVSQPAMQHGTAQQAAPIQQRQPQARPATVPARTR